MGEIYGSRWERQYGLCDEHGTWRLGLAGITPAQMAAGLRACIASSDAWPPSLPQFRRYCLGIPDLKDAASRLSDGSPFSRLMWQFIDGWRYSQANYGECERIVAAAYHRAVEHLEAGGEMPEQPVARIERREPARASRPGDRRMSGEEAIAAMKRCLGMPA